MEGLTWRIWGPLVTVELDWVTMTFSGEASLLMCSIRLEPVQIIIAILPTFCIICMNNRLNGSLEEKGTIDYCCFEFYEAFTVNG